MCLIIPLALLAAVVAGAYILTPLRERLTPRDFAGDDRFVRTVRGYAAPSRVRGSAAAQVWQARSPKDGAQPVPAHLSAIAQRTLLLWGGDDPAFPAAEAHGLARILPNATLKIVEGAGHLPHEEREPVVAAAILAFLADDEGRAQGEG
ncbi:MAG TPA: alpha/beta fold hydrolase [Roseiflexaceae bacterium]